MQWAESTLEDVRTEQSAVATWGRRGFLALLLILVLAGLAGLLGVSTATTVAEQDGYELSLEHATVARAGLDVPWEVTVRHPGGFDQTLTLAVTGDYFDLYETQGFTPTPSETTRDRDTLYLTFEAPPGETFVLDYDAYVAPASQRGRAGSVSVVVQGGERVATVEFTTRLLP